MLARRLPGLLPDLVDREALEVTRIHSAVGGVEPGAGLVRRPPFRAPHHGASSAALVGGGPGPSPGELTRAHRGVLFLDELGEFSRVALEALRQPLEDGEVVVVRASGRARFPGGRAARRGDESVSRAAARARAPARASSSTATAHGSRARCSTGSTSS